jgi:DNA-directed RNA polymerase specialized sigma24 family protein
VTDATEAPAPSSLTEPAESDAGQSDSAQIDAAVTAFRRQLDGQVSVPASVVQDCLLDLWGSLPEGESRSEVERWLTETLERTLYSASDVAARLATVVPADD